MTNGSEPRNQGELWPHATSTAKRLFLFLDESGNFDFTLNGSKYIQLTAVACERPFPIDAALNGLRYDLIEDGLDLEYFHATNDRQAVRDRVFELIQQHLDRFRAFTWFVEKRRVPGARRSRDRCHEVYSDLLITATRALVHTMVIGEPRRYDELIVVTDSIPIQGDRRRVEKAVKQTLSATLPPSARYRLMHHASKSSWGLQIADYINWAIFRLREKGDDRSYVLIRQAVVAEFDATDPADPKNVTPP